VRNIGLLADFCIVVIKKGADVLYVSTFFLFTKGTAHQFGIYDLL